MGSRDRSVTVYSTESGRICPKCGQPVAECRCGKSSQPPKGDGIVRVGMESKGRKGKEVTVITGLGLPEAGMKDLLTEIKKKCGSGGTLKDYVIEIQGDHRDKIVTLLREKKFTVRKSGG